MAAVSRNPLEELMNDDARVVVLFEDMFAYLRAHEGSITENTITATMQTLRLM